MNINLGSLFVNNEGSNMMQQIQQADNGEIKEALLSGKIADIKSLLPGMLFEGDVADINNLQVKIILSDSSVLNASMKEAVNFNIGEHVIFQVKENSGSKIVIRPFQNNGESAVITKALNASGITINEKNASVVKELMTQGQPLDKNTIMDTVRLVNRFPEAELSDIIELKKHGIPINSDNITMYKAYSEGNANISASLSTISEDVPKVIVNILSKNENPQSMKIVSDILNIIMPEESDDKTVSVKENESSGTAQNAEVTKDGQEVRENEAFRVPIKDNFGLENEDTIKNETVMPEDGKVIKSFINKENTDLQQPDKVSETQERQVKADENVVEKNTKTSTETFGKVSKEVQPETSKEMQSEIPQKASEEVHKEFAEKISKEMPQKTSEEVNVTKGDRITSAIKHFEEIAKKTDEDKSIDMKAVKRDIIKIFKEAEPVQQKIMAESEPFKKLIQNVIKKNMFIKPDIIKESENPKEEIGRLYEKIKEQLDKLSESVKEAVSKGMLDEKQSLPLLNNAKTANQNMNFMNELNNMASYMQIPVKFASKETAGELYVYNRNVKKTAEEGITAFLHFDLESLGATDIRISLKNKGLRIGFELSDALSVKLVEKHIDELLNRLEEKGYFVNCSVERKEEKEHNSLEKIFEQDNKQVSIKRYTLDIRT